VSRIASPASGERVRAGRAGGGAGREPAVGSNAVMPITIGHHAGDLL
jgi:hypothetical protein